ncbi:MAG: MFS transporter [Dehalococcoidales bacterium]|nr:MFS transporter [Dehalococcoidales bacterium]
MLSTIYQIKDRIFYGWVVVWACFVVFAIFMGTSSSFGVFFKELASEFNLSRTTTSAIFSGYMVLGSAFPVLGGWALDRFGPKVIVLIMGGVTGLALILISRTTAAWQLFLTFSLLLSMGSRASYTIVMSTASRWFNRQRGLAVGIVGAGQALGTVIFAPLAAYIISSFDWRIAYIVMGVIAIVFIMPMSLVLKKDPDEIGTFPDGVKSEPVDSQFSSRAPVHGISQSTSLSMFQALRTRSFWLFNLLWLSSAFSLFLLLTHVVPHITDMGFSSIQAATFLSLNGIAAMAGGIIMGTVSDRVGKKRTAVICSLLSVGFVLSLVWADKLWVLYLVAVVLGFAQGGEGIATTALIADTFGVANIGKIMGTLSVSWGIGAGLGPVSGGLIYDKIGDYALAFMIMAVMTLVRALFIILIRPKITTAGDN